MIHEARGRRRRDNSSEFHESRFFGLGELFPFAEFPTRRESCAGSPAPGTSIFNISRLKKRPGPPLNGAHSPAELFITPPFGSVSTQYAPSAEARA